MSEVWPTSLDRYKGMVKLHQKAVEALKLAADNDYPEEILQILSKVEENRRPPKLERATNADFGYHAGDSSCQHKLDPWEWNGIRCIFCGVSFCY